MIVRSEINLLESVITHKPGNEHLFVLPHNTREINEINGGYSPNPDFLLFDDIIDQNRMKGEHNLLSSILDAWTDNNNFSVINLAMKVLKSKDLRKKLINDCIKIDRKSYPEFSTLINIDSLIELKVTEFISVLLTGIHPRTGEKVFYLPIPNLMFTRDIGFVMGNTLVITQASHNARKRETAIAACILKNHSLFSKYNIIEMSHIDSENSLEGGDVMIFDSNTIIIGLSQRTLAASIENLMEFIFSENFSRLIVVDLPKQRELMHLDTILTKININECILFPPIFFDRKFANHQIEIYEFTKAQKFNQTSPLKCSFFELLSNGESSIEVIKCGGENPIDQIREQWTDGANAFALAPGKIIGYDRNYKTLEALQNAGYKILKPENLLNNLLYWKKSTEKFIVSMPGSELVRGRGGMRCLTLPLSRENNESY